jgi:NADH-quinone oxidoreductase subunit C
VLETDIKWLANILPHLPQAIQSQILSVEEFRGETTLTVRRESVREVIQFLKTDPNFGFDVMMDLFAMDYLKYVQETPERFAVVYYLVSLLQNRRVHIKVFLPEEDPTIASIHDLYKAADWFEREAWDLYGIKFEGHPNLVRILCHAEFEGHPLRKDYPSDRYQRLKTTTSSEGL